jgi:hypothetical protein
MGHVWFTLDDQFRRQQIIEGFQSFIWTERFNTAGDFQIVAKSTHANRQLYADQTWIGKQGSTYIMKIDTIQDAIDENTNAQNLTITGKSLEFLLDDRVAMPGLDDLATTPNWVITGTPGAIARELFSRVCFETALDVHDNIPNYQPGTLLTEGNLGEPTDTITLTASPDTLYSTLTQLCAAYSLGFRFVRNGDAGEVYFEIYVGNDLTSNQGVLPAVIFDQNMDNLIGQNVLNSSSILKTVAYVYATNGMQIVYAPTADPAAEGAGRRVMLVNSSNDADAGPDLDAALRAEGLIALAAQRQVYAFDGKIPPGVSYVYGQDYALGDLVEERNSDGFGGLMLVTEHISSSDTTGDTEYPTLSVSQVITPGSWLNFEGDNVWADIPDTVHWADL